MKQKLLLLLVWLALAASSAWAQIVVSGTITGTSCVAIDVTGKGVVGISITNTQSGSAWSGAIQPQLSIGGDTAQNTTVTPYNSTTSQSSITANGAYQSYVTGATTFTLCGNTVTNTANVKLQAISLAARSGGGGSGGGAQISGTPSAGQIAAWVSSTQVQGLAGLTFSSSTLTVSVAGSGNGAIALSGNTSGTATFTAPATAGTATNPVVASNAMTFPNGAQANPSVNFSGSTTTGLYYAGGNNWCLVSSGTDVLCNGSVAVKVTSGGFYCYTNSGDANGTNDTCMNRPAAKVFQFGDGGGTPNAFMLSANKAFVTSDFTSANSAALQAITGLSFAFPSLAMNVSFHCALMYSQATNVAGDQFGVGVITTAPTNVNTLAQVATNSGAATPITNGVLNGLATTTPTAVVTFTPGGTGIFNAYLDGTAELAGGGAATLNIYVLNGTAADVIVVKRGSFCTIQ